jgi:hypothetical protein
MKVVLDIENHPVHARWVRLAGKCRPVEIEPPEFDLFAAGK